MEEMGYVEDESDFDLVLGDILDIFSDEPEDAVLQRAHKTYKRLTVQERKIVAKKAAFHMAPKVMKNDIRRHFSRMFMNTINSGDFGKLQDYFNTFMMGQTKFVANHQEINPSLKIPSLLTADGPRLMAHYLLGSFVMYPDMVLIMNGSRVTTSKSWSGTKIEIDVETFSTKMYELSMEDWVPQLCTLGDRYNKLIAEKKKLLDAQNNVPKDSQCVHADTSTKSHSSKSLSSNDTVTSEDSDITTSSETSCAEPGNNGSASIQEIASTETDVLISSECNGTTKGGKKNKSGRKRKVPTGDNTGNSVSSNDGSVTAMTSHIPEEFVHSLCAHATLLPQPVELHMVGMITMFLDVNNHIQHMNMTLRQV